MTQPIHNLTDKNKFICAAIMGEDGNMYLGARHSHCFVMLRNAGVKQVDHNSQGFMLGDGSFIDRYDGMVLARNTGQLIKGSDNNSDILFSEDLW